jgi:hypothetical protein
MVADTISGELSLFESLPDLPEGASGAYFMSPPKGPLSVPALVREEPLLLEHRAFQNSLLSGDTSALCSLAEGLKTIEVVEEVLSHCESER